MSEFKTRFDFLGLSTESKPTDKAVNGTTFYEVDTSKLYIFYKNNWYRKYKYNQFEPSNDITGDNLTINNTIKKKFIKAPIPRGNATQASTPTPDSPVDIKTVSGDSNVYITNKNLLKINNVTQTTKNGVTYKIQDGEITFNGTATTGIDIVNIGEFIQANANYTWTFIYESGSCTDYQAGFYLDTTSGGTSSVGGGAGLRASQSRTAILNSTTNTRKLYLYCHINSGCVFSNYKLKMQIVKGTTADYNFVKNEQQTLPLTLGNIELCKIGDYQDYIYKDSGKWYKKNVIGKVVLDGDNYAVSGKNSATTNDFSITPVLTGVLPVTSNNQIGKIISSHFEAKSANNIYLNDGTGIALMTSNALAIEFTLASEISTKELANTWLSIHNVTVYYVLATSTDTEITDTTLIGQLEKILKTTSYDGQTNIFGTSEGSEPLFDVKVYKEVI